MVPLIAIVPRLTAHDCLRRLAQLRSAMSTPHFRIADAILS